MNTIYDNTFVLGQTSAMNFVAGPGIKIDEPSAGTVRIGNDETVLWENQSGYTEPPITLSESLSSFKTIKFVGRNEGSTSNYIPYKVWEFDTDSLKISNYITLEQIMPNNPGNNWNAGIYCRVSNLDASVDKTLTIAKTDSYAITSAGTWSRQTSDSWGNVRLHKVIGIGRKENA